MAVKIQNTNTDANGRVAGTDFKYQLTGTDASGRVPVVKIMYQETGTDAAGRKVVWERPAQSSNSTGSTS